MLDRKYIIQNADAVRQNCQRRGVACDIDKIIELDGKRIADAAIGGRIEPSGQRDQQEFRRPRTTRNAALVEKGRELRSQKRSRAEKNTISLMRKSPSCRRRFPIMTHPDVPIGGEEDAKELAFGKTPINQFDFKPLDHVRTGR